MALLVFFATDVYGSERTFRKSVNAGKLYHVDHIVMGGDVTGNDLVPIVRQHDGRYRMTMQGTTELPDGDSALQAAEEAVETLCFDHLIGRVAFITGVANTNSIGFATAIVLDSGVITGVSGAAKHLEAKARIAELLDIKINCAGRLKNKTDSARCRVSASREGRGCRGGSIPMGRATAGWLHCYLRGD